MGEIVEGLDRERVATLRAAEFFWIDVSLADADARELTEVLAVPPHAADVLLDFQDDAPPSRRFYADEECVAFALSCFPDGEAVETHLLVTADFVATVHREPVRLAQRLEVPAPAERPAHSLVYAVLEAMVASAFVVLDDIETRLESLQIAPADLRPRGIRTQQLREITADLARVRRRVAPQRSTFRRAVDEVSRVPGLGEAARPLDRVSAQLDRLIDSIDAAGDGISKLIDLRVNETMYWLTVVATVFLPLTFVTGFFGMNFGWMVDHIDSFLAFLVFGVGGCALGVLLTLAVIRRRGTPVDLDDD